MMVLAEHLDYQIILNAFVPGEKNSIFFTENFFKMHSTSGDIYAQLVDIRTKKVKASLIFYQQRESPSSFISPIKGTFGGIQLDAVVSSDILDFFFTSLKNHLLDQGVTRITIKSAPFSHNIQVSSLEANLFARHNFKPTAYDLNYSMFVDERIFSSRMDYGNLKRLRKCIREGFVAKENNINQLANIYNVISANRKRRGYPLTMNLNQLNKMFEIFPEHIKLFSVNGSDDQMLAAAICLVISPKILYVFYWGDAEGMEKYSPIVMIADYIYKYCHENKYQILDVGTSTVNGQPNSGLINFKRGLGFKESLKLTYLFEKDS